MGRPKPRRSLTHFPKGPRTDGRTDGRTDEVRDDREMRLLHGGAMEGREIEREREREREKEGRKVERRALILLLSGFPRNDANGPGEGRNREGGREEPRKKGSDMYTEGRTNFRRGLGSVVCNVHLAEVEMA